MAVCSPLSQALPIFTALSFLSALSETALWLLLGVFAFYALYILKVRLGIDIFPDWGLHLYGPRRLVRWLLAKAKRLVVSTGR
ncbi:MAG TPA: hypothetical protein VN668_14880 [Stellaceae bacterium]|nr:hypothetical protein [Stellaceae bacterium]